MNVDAYEQIHQGGWEHIPDYSNRQANSNSSAGGSSNVLSPSLQSYLNANDPSWAADNGSPSSPPRYHLPRRDPTAIYRAEIARIGRRFGLTNRTYGGGNSHRSTAAAGSTLAGSRRSRLSRDARAVDGIIAGGNRARLGTQRSYQVEGFLEQGWDGKVALVGKRSGRGAGRAALAESASRPDSSRIWDSPPPVRQTARSAGPIRSQSSGHMGLSSPAADLWGVTDASINTEVRGRRPSTAPALQPSSSSEQRRGRSRNAQLAGGREAVGRWPSDSDEGRYLLPEISRSTSPTPPSPHHGRNAVGNIFGTASGNKNREESYHSRRRPGVLPVRALLLLPDWSIGHEVSAVTASPFDSVSSLRAAIQADIVRDTRGMARKTGAGDASGLRTTGGDSECPIFSFFYADGVAIDRGQEERLSVKDIAIDSTSPDAGTAANGFDPGWEDDDRSDGGGCCKEMAVFLRASDSGTEQVGIGDGSGGGGGGGVLHRWESLREGSWGNEAFWRGPASAGSRESAFSKAGGPGGSSSSSIFPSPASSSFDAAGEGQRAPGQGHDVPGLVGGVPLRAGSMSASSIAERTQRHVPKRFSVSFDESKAARRRMIQEQVILLASSKVTLITKVFRGYQTRILFEERLRLHRQACKIQLCVRQRAAKHELDRRVRRRDKAVRIQCLARSRHSRREAAVRRDRRVAATRIQGSARSKAAKKELKARRDQRREAMADAARKKVEDDEAREAAERTAREVAESRRKAEEEEEEEECAIARIQSFARTTGAKREAAKRRENKRAADAKKVHEQSEAALQLQCFSRARAAKVEATERRKRKEAASRIQLKARQRAAKKRTGERREAVRKVQQRKEEEQRQAATRIQAVAKGKRARARVRDIKSRKENASVKITAAARGRRGRRRVLKMRREKDAAVVIQKTARGKRGRARFSARADRRRAERSEETAATSIQKVARGNSDRALFRHLKEDMDNTRLYAAATEGGRSGDSARGEQDGSGAPMEEEDGPRRVGFLTGTLSHEIAENVAASMALDLDERVRSFVAVQTTVRRAENTVKGASGGENVEEYVLDGRMKIVSDVPACAEPEQHSNLSESDFLLSLSASGSLEEETQAPGQAQVRGSGFQSRYVPDDARGQLVADSGGVRAGSDPKDREDADLPRSETEEGQGVFKSDFALDDETGSVLTAPEANQSGDDMPHADEPEATGSGTEEGQEIFKSDFALDCESGSVLTTESRGDDIGDDKGEEVEWKSDFVLELPESEDAERGEVPTGEPDHAENVSVVDRSHADDGSGLAMEEILQPVGRWESDFDVVFVPTSGDEPAKETGLEGAKPVETAAGTSRPLTEGGDDQVVLPDGLSIQSENTAADVANKDDPQDSAEGQDVNWQPLAYEPGTIAAEGAVGVQGAVGVKRAVGMEGAPEVACVKADAVESSACVAINEIRSQGAKLPDVVATSADDRITQAADAEAGKESTGTLSLEPEDRPAPAPMGDPDVDILRGRQEAADSGEAASAERGINESGPPNEGVPSEASDQASAAAHTGDAAAESVDLDLSGSPGRETACVVINKCETTPVDASSETVHSQHHVAGGEGDSASRIPRDFDEVESADVRSSNEGIEAALSTMGSKNADVTPAENPGTDGTDGVVANPASGMSVSPEGAATTVALSQDAVVPSGDTAAEALCVQETTATGEEGAPLVDGDSPTSILVHDFSPEADENEALLAVGITAAVTPPSNPQASDQANGAHTDPGPISPASCVEESVVPRGAASPCSETDATPPNEDGADPADPAVPAAGQGPADAADSALVEPERIRSASPQKGVTEVAEDETLECGKAQDVVGVIDGTVEVESSPAGIAATFLAVGHLAEGVEAAPPAVENPRADVPSTAAGANDNTAEGDLADPGLACSTSSTGETTAVGIVQSAIATKDGATDDAATVRGVTASGEDGVKSASGMEPGEGCFPGAEDEGTTVGADNTGADAPLADQRAGDAAADGFVIDSALAGPASPTEGTMAVSVHQPLVGVSATRSSEFADRQDTTAVVGSVGEDQDADKGDQDSDVVAQDQPAGAGLYAADDRPTHTAVSNADATKAIADQEVADGGVVDAAVAATGSGTPVYLGDETPEADFDRPPAVSTDNDDSEQATDPDSVNVRQVVDTGNDDGGLRDAGAGVGAEVQSGEDALAHTTIPNASVSVSDASADVTGPGQEGADLAHGSHDTHAGSGLNASAPRFEEAMAAAIDQSAIAPAGTDSSKEAIDGHPPVPPEGQATGVDNYGVARTCDGASFEGVQLQDDGTAHGRCEEVLAADIDPKEGSKDEHHSKEYIEATANVETPDRDASRMRQETADVDVASLPDFELGASLPSEEVATAANSDRLNESPAGNGVTKEAVTFEVEAVDGVGDVQVPTTGIGVEQESAEDCCPEADTKATTTVESGDVEVPTTAPKLAGVARNAFADPPSDGAVSPDIQATLSTTAAVLDQPGIALMSSPEEEHVHPPMAVVDAEGTPAEADCQEADPEVKPPEAGNKNAVDVDAENKAISNFDDFSANPRRVIPASPREDEGGADIEKTDLAPAGDDTSLLGTNLHEEGIDGDVEPPENETAAEAAGERFSADETDAVPAAIEESSYATTLNPDQEPLVSAGVGSADDARATCVLQLPPSAVPHNGHAPAASGPSRDPSEAKAQHNAKEELDKEETSDVDTKSSRVVDEGAVSVTSGSEPPLGDTDTNPDQTKLNATAQARQEKVRTENKESGSIKPVLDSADGSTEEHSTAPADSGKTAAEVPLRSKTSSDANAGKGSELALTAGEVAPEAREVSSTQRSAPIGDDGVLETPPISVVPEIEVSRHTSDAPEVEPEEIKASQLVTPVVEASAESATGPMVSLTGMVPGIFVPASAVVDHVPGAAEDDTSVATAEAIVPDNMSECDRGPADDDVINSPTESNVELLEPPDSVAADSGETEEKPLAAAVPAAPLSDEPEKQSDEETLRAVGLETLGVGKVQLPAPPEGGTVPPSQSAQAVVTAEPDENLTVLSNSAVPNGTDTSPADDVDQGVTAGRLLTTSAKLVDTARSEAALGPSVIGATETTNAVEVVGGGAGEVPLLEVDVGGNDETALLAGEKLPMDALKEEVSAEATCDDISVQSLIETPSTEKTTPSANGGGTDAGNEAQLVGEHSQLAEPLAGGPALAVDRDVPGPEASQSPAESLQAAAVDEISNGDEETVVSQRATNLGAAAPALVDAAGINSEPLVPIDLGAMDASGSAQTVDVADPALARPSAEVASDSPEAEGVQRASPVSDDVADEAVVESTDHGSIAKLTEISAGVPPSDMGAEAVPEQTAPSTELLLDSAEVITVAAPNEDTKEEESLSLPRSLPGVDKVPEAEENLVSIATADNAEPSGADIEGSSAETVSALSAPRKEEATPEDQEAIHQSDEAERPAFMAEGEPGSSKNNKLGEARVPALITTAVDDEPNVVIQQNVDGKPSGAGADTETKSSEGSQKGGDDTVAPTDDASSPVPDDETCTPSMGEQGPLAIDGSLSATAVPSARASKEEEPSEASEQGIRMPGEAFLEAGAGEGNGVKPTGETSELDDRPPTSVNALEVVKCEDQQTLAEVPDAVDTTTENVVQNSANGVGSAAQEVGDADECVAIEAVGANENIPAEATGGSTLKLAHVAVADATEKDREVAKVYDSVTDALSDGATESQTTSNGNEAVVVQGDDLGEVEQPDSRNKEEGVVEAPNALEASDVSGSFGTDVHQVLGGKYSEQTATATTNQELLHGEPAGVSPSAIPCVGMIVSHSGEERPHVITGESVTCPVVEAPGADVPLGAASTALGDSAEMLEADEVEDEAPLVEDNDHSAAGEQLPAALAEETRPVATETLHLGGNETEKSPANVPDKESDEPLNDEGSPRMLVNEGLTDTARDGESNQISPLAKDENLEIPTVGMETPQPMVEASAAATSLGGGTAQGSSLDTSNESQNSPVVEAAEGEPSDVADTTPSTAGAGDKDVDKATIDSQPVAATAETVARDGVEKDVPPIPNREEDVVTQEVARAPNTNDPSDIAEQDTPDVAQPGKATEATQKPVTAAAEGMFDFGLTSPAHEAETPGEVLLVVPIGNLDVPPAGAEGLQTDADNTLVDTVSSVEDTEGPPPPAPTGSFDRSVDETAALATQKQRSDEDTVDTDSRGAVISDDSVVQQPQIASLAQNESGVEGEAKDVLHPEERVEEASEEPAKAPPVNASSDVGEETTPEEDEKVAPIPEDAHGQPVDLPVAAVTDDVPVVVRVQEESHEGETTGTPKDVVIAEKLDDPSTVLEVAHGNPENTTPTAEGEKAEEQPPAAPDLDLDTPIFGVDVSQAEAKDGATTAILDGEAGGVPPTPTPPGTQIGTILLMAEDEAPDVVDEAVVTATSGDDYGSEDISEQPPIPMAPQTELTSEASEGILSTPEQGEEVTTQDVIDAPVGSTTMASDASVEAEPETEPASQAVMMVEDVHGATIDHPAAVAINGIPSVVLGSTPQDGETAEELPSAVHDENPNDLSTVVPVPHTSSQDVVAPAKGEPADGLPLVVTTRSSDFPGSETETAKTGADGSVAAAALEEKATGVPPPAVPRESGDEAAFLVVEVQPPTVADEAVVTCAVGDESGDHAVTEQSSQVKTAAMGSEDRPPTPKQEEEAVMPGVVHAPVTVIASDASVEATSEVKGKVDSISEDVHGATAEYSVTATTDKIPPLVPENTPQKEETAKEPPQPVTEDELGSPGTDMQVVSEDVAATIEGETAGDLLAAVPQRDTPVLSAEKPHTGADDRASTDPVRDETFGVSRPAVPDEIRDEAAVLLAEDKSSGPGEEAIVASAVGDEPGDKAVTGRASQIEETAGTSDDDPPIPKQDEEVVTPDVTHTPHVGTVSDTSADATPDGEGPADVGSGGIDVPTIEPPVAGATDEVPPVVQENIPHERDTTEAPPGTMNEEQVDSPGTFLVVEQTNLDDIVSNAEGGTAEEPLPAVPDLNLDAHTPSVVIGQPVAGTAVVDGEAGDVQPPDVPRRTQNNTTLLMAEDEPTGAVDEAAMAVATRDKLGDEGGVEETPTATAHQDETVAEGSEDGLITPHEGGEMGTQDMVGTTVESVSSEMGVDLTPGVEGKGTTVVEDTHGTTVEHPPAAAIDDVLSVGRENTPQDEQAAKEPPFAVTDEELNNPGCDSQAPQASPGDIAGTIDGEAAGGPPPAASVCSLDDPVINSGSSQAVADATANDSILEKEIAGVSPPAVPKGTQNEATVLIAKDNPPGAVVVVTSLGANDPEGVDVTEDPPIAGVPQDSFAAGTDVDSSEPSQVGKGAIMQEAVPAPVDTAASASDTGVEAMLAVEGKPEVDQAKQTSAMLEDVDGTTVNLLMAAASDEATSVVPAGAVADELTAQVPQASVAVGDAVALGPGVGINIGEQGAADSTAKGTMVDAEQVLSGTADEKIDTQDASAGAILPAVSTATSATSSPVGTDVKTEPVEEGSVDPCAPSSVGGELENSGTRPENAGGGRTDIETRSDVAYSPGADHGLSGGKLPSGSDETSSNESLPTEAGDVGETVNNATSQMDVTPEEPTTGGGHEDEEPGKNVAGSPDGGKLSTSEFHPDIVLSEEPHVETEERA